MYLPIKFWRNTEFSTNNCVPSKGFVGVIDHVQCEKNS